MKKEVSGDWAQLEVASKEENVGMARVCAASFASRLDFTLPEIEEIRVAVSEAVSNSVLYAYPDDETGLIRITLQVSKGVFEVQVQDWGRGIEDVDSALNGDFAEGEGMGLGFIFMDSFMDDLRVDSAPGEGTVVAMKKRPSKAGEGEVSEEAGRSTEKTVGIDGNDHRMSSGE